MAVQKNWRMCSLCMGIFFNGHLSKGRCPFDLPGFGTGQHQADPFVHFQFSFASPKKPNSQDNWWWCIKCEGLFFHGNLSDGRCPARGLYKQEVSTTTFQAETIKFNSPQIKR